MKDEKVKINKSNIHGRGVFATRNYKKGETILRWDMTHILSQSTLNKLPKNKKERVNIVNDRYILMQAPEKYVNHSCDPNTQMVNGRDVAIKNIKKGQEITSNYHRSLTDKIIRCRCGKNKCKKIIADFALNLPLFPDGRINYTDTNVAPVLTCFVKYKNLILLLKRGEKVRTYRGLWNTVAGYLDDERPLEQKAREELREELAIGPGRIKQIRIGKPYKFTDKKINKTWIIFPMLAELKTKSPIKLDWEHTDYKWVEPQYIDKFDTVPNFKKSLNSALATLKIT